MGTPLYMSPEQVQGKPLDSRSDIYSLGVTCYHMLTGGPPFKGETVLGVAVQHLETAPEPLESLRPDLPPALCRVIHQMLAKEPERRLASARDLLGELRRVQFGAFRRELAGAPARLGLAGRRASARSADRADARTRPADESGGVRAAGPGPPGLARGRVARHGGLRRRRWPGSSCPPRCLADAQAPTVIPKETNVIRQVYRASQIGTEAAWQSVLTYFPDKQILHASRQGAVGADLFREGKLDRAMEIFEKLAHLSDEEAELRAFGLAGMYGVLSLRGKYGQCDAVLNQLLPIRDKLTSEPMQRLLNHAIDRNRSKISPQTAGRMGQMAERAVPRGVNLTVRPARGGVCGPRTRRAGAHQADHLGAVLGGGQIDRFFSGWRPPRRTAPLRRRRRPACRECRAAFRPSSYPPVPPA